MEGQSRQSAKLFLKSSALGPPNPSPTGECAPPSSAGRGTFAGERGVGRVPIPTRGHTLWYSVHIYVLCGWKTRKEWICCFSAKKFIFKFVSFRLIIVFTS
jgi:hypothetical protein